MMARRIYLSSNGDTWDLMREGTKVLVRHQPNVSSGGLTSDFDLDVFLGWEKHSPQVNALVELIGTLVSTSDAPET